MKKLTNEQIGSVSGGDTIRCFCGQGLAVYNNINDLAEMGDHMCKIICCNNIIIAYVYYTIYERFPNDAGGYYRRGDVQSCSMVHPMLYDSIHSSPIKHY